MRSILIHIVIPVLIAYALAQSTFQRGVQTSGLKG